MAMLVGEALDEYLEAARSIVGKLTTAEESGSDQYNEQATRDTIRHYAWGVSDFNPLWLDHEYARQSRYGTIVAPPTFPYSVVLPSMGAWLVPVPTDQHWSIAYGGTSWQFFHPIKLGDGVHATAKLVDASIKVSKTNGRMIVLTSEVEYWNDRNELVARALSPQLRFLAPGANAARTSDPQGRARSSDEAPLPPLEVLAERWSRRGAEALYWEDVQEGQPLPEMAMGALRMSDIIRWYGGAYGPPLGSTRIGSARDLAGAGHYDSERAQSGGVPGAYDNGPLRGAWLSQLVTNWMGDWGDLKQLQYSLRRFNLVGDVNTVQGRVERKWLEDDQGHVSLVIQVQNDRAQATAEGIAIVALPRRG